MLLLYCTLMSATVRELNAWIVSVRLNCIFNKFQFLFRSQIHSLSKESQNEISDLKKKMLEDNER